MLFIKKLSTSLFLTVLFFSFFINNSFAQTTSVPNPSITINNQSEYTVRTGELVPVFSWNANLPTGANVSDYKFKTKVSLNSSKLCSGVRNGSKSLAGNSVSGTYTPTEIAIEKREGCEITFKYEVFNKKTKKKYTANAVLKYVGENSGTNRGRLVAGLIQGEAADAQKTKTNATLFTGTDAYVVVDGFLPDSQNEGTIYKVVINDDVSIKTVDATLIKTTTVESGKTIKKMYLKFTTPGNIALKSGVKVYVEYGTFKSNVHSVRVTCGIVCPGGPVTNPNTNTTLNSLLSNPNNNSTPTLAPQTSVVVTPRTVIPTTQTPVTNPTTTTDPVPTATNNLQPTLTSASKTTVAPGERILLTGTNILTSGTNNIDFIRKSDGAKYTFTQSKKGGKTTAIFFTVPTTIQGQALTAGEYTITLRTIYGTSNSLTVTVTTTTATETSPIIPIVSQGARGESVMFVQYALQQAGFFTEEITGYFGNITKAAVQAFQNANALENIGAVGPRTAELLNSLLD